LYKGIFDIEIKVLVKRQWDCKKITAAKFRGKFEHGNDEYQYLVYLN